MLASIMVQIDNFLFAIYWALYMLWVSIKGGLIFMLIEDWIDAFLSLIR